MRLEGWRSAVHPSFETRAFLQQPLRSALLRMRLRVADLKRSARPAAFASISIERDRWTRGVVIKCAVRRLTHRGRLKNWCVPKGWPATGTISTPSRRRSPARATRCAASSIPPRPHRARRAPAWRMGTSNAGNCGRRLMASCAWAANPARISLQESRGSS